jgi:hypothetical protein
MCYLKRISTTNMLSSGKSGVDGVDGVGVDVLISLPPSQNRSPHPACYLLAGFVTLPV